MASSFHFRDSHFNFPSVFLTVTVNVCSNTHASWISLFWATKNINFHPTVPVHLHNFPPFIYLLPAVSSQVPLILPCQVAFRPPHPLHKSYIGSIGAQFLWPPEVVSKLYKSKLAFVQMGKQARRSKQGGAAWFYVT